MNEYGHGPTGQVSPATIPCECDGCTERRECERCSGRGFAICTDGSRPVCWHSCLAADARRSDSFSLGLAGELTGKTEVEYRASKRRVV